MRLAEIQIRDPFVLVEPGEAAYYLFGSTDENIWSGPGVGFDCYRSTDLVEWDGPYAAFRPPAGFWSPGCYWAPEVYRIGDAWFMFATFGLDDRERGTQVLRAAVPAGPYEVWSDGPVTPEGWLCLDGTLHLDDDGPWMVFCHEWPQVGDGTMCAVRLSTDLRGAVGEPITLFRASDAPWAKSLGEIGHPASAGSTMVAYVTDGPFLHRGSDGSLMMLWSSFGAQGYAMGVAQSASGALAGPWTQEDEPLWAADGGHGMVFRDLEGQLMLTLHQPNTTPLERALFVPLDETGNSLRRMT